MSDYTELREHLLAQGRSERTVASYLSDIAHFARWLDKTGAKQLRPGGFSPSDVRQYKRYLQTVKNAAASTVNRRLTALRAYSQWALSSGKTQRDSLLGIKSVSGGKSNPKVLDRREQTAILEEASNSLSSATTRASRRQALRDLAIVLTLLHTGLRVSELCSLELQDLDLEPHRGAVNVKSVNGRKSRAVPLNSDARQAMQSWLAVRPQVENQAIFVGKHGEPASPLLVQRLLSELGKRAGLNVTPHTLRHTFAKNLVEQGVSLEKVAQLLGHRDLNATKVYSSSEQTDLAWAVEALVE
ncbi:MAG TPA: tyrosine-type recombinase/integrase [Anaerolineales bacterium]|nr:tyrosine-type recombinase/integrase [Anaerolineales bacterium]